MPELFVLIERRDGGNVVNLEDIHFCLQGDCAVQRLRGLLFSTGRLELFQVENKA
jgi:hypothetical protein